MGSLQQGRVLPTTDSDVTELTDSISTPDQLQDDLHHPAGQNSVVHQLRHMSRENTRGSNDPSRSPAQVLPAIVEQARDELAKVDDLSTWLRHGFTNDARTPLSVSLVIAKQRCSSGDDGNRSPTLGRIRSRLDLMFMHELVIEVEVQLKRLRLSRFIGSRLRGLARKSSGAVLGFEVLHYPLDLGRALCRFPTWMVFSLGSLSMCYIKSAMKDSVDELQSAIRQHADESFFLQYSDKWESIIKDTKLSVSNTAEALIKELANLDQTTLESLQGLDIAALGHIYPLSPPSTRSELSRPDLRSSADSTGSTGLNSRTSYSTPDQDRDGSSQPDNAPDAETDRRLGTWSPSSIFVDDRELSVGIAARTGGACVSPRMDYDLGYDQRVLSRYPMD